MVLTLNDADGAACAVRLYDQRDYLLSIRPLGRIIIDWDIGAFARESNSRRTPHTGVTTQ